MKNAKKFITNEGKELIQRVNNYGLGRFYDIYTGTIQIEVEDFTNEVEEKVNNFLGDNQEFNLIGYNEYGEEVEQEEVSIYIVSDYTE